MDLERIAGVEPPVDEDAVHEEVAAYVGGVELHREPWKITSLGQADWAMRRFAEARALAQTYQDEIDLWTVPLKKIRAAAGWFEDRLKEWAIEQRTPSLKTIRTAHGTIPTRQSQPKITVVDEAEAIGWGWRVAPDTIKQTEKFLVSAIGDRASIVECVVAYESVDKTTGEVERIPVMGSPVPLVPAMLDQLRERMGDGYTVDAVTEPFVVDVEGMIVPGLTVTPGDVTATVTPLGA